ncbi:uncharacterized protein LOC117602943 isoform X1 [Osmia lignaria lignaria]|uniref:uncharacterized protein LOC117602943 isoform X1 n=2 Tax=Osmia lignaria lignaria TaxID=1437193 RepID=UPI00402BDC48
MIIMKKLQILRVDNDLVQKIDLQIGNNIIGRSVVPGCDDNGAIKHAVTIYVTSDNEMTITPHQISPCYMKSVESSQWKLLKLGITVPIKPGDICSLIPDKCWFKVLLVPDNMDTLKRKVNDAIDYNMSGKKCCSKSGEGDNLGTPCDILNEIITENNNNDINKAKPDDTDSKDDNLSNPKDITSTTEEKSEEVYGASSKDKGKEYDSSDKLTSEPQNTDQSCKKEEDVNNLQTESKAETNIPTNESNVSTTTTTVNTPRREKCKYGEKCYRKNPQHKAEYSHPEDADYNIPDNREECPYGSRCYRKNPQHKMQFKHTSRKTRNEYSKQRRKRSPTTVFSDTLSDFEDSSEEESVDESEYEPSSDLESFDDDEVYSDNNRSEND